MKNRKSYGRWNIGRLEIEAGWFPGEDIGLSASILTFRRGHINLLYLQVAKLCFSLGVDTGPSPEAVAEWGKGFEALGHRGPAPAAPKVPPPPGEELEPTEGQIGAARMAATTIKGFCGVGNNNPCDHCPGIDSQGRRGFCEGSMDPDGEIRRAKARAWLEERGIPIYTIEGVEAPAPVTPEAAE